MKTENSSFKSIKLKLLYTGNFSSGSISAPGIQNALALIVIAGGELSGVTMFGHPGYGVGGYGAYGGALSDGSHGVTVWYRYAVSQDKMSIDTYNTGICSNNGTRAPAKTIWGLFLE